MSTLLSTLEAAADELARLAGRPVRMFSTCDFGREQVPAARSVLVPEEQVLNVLQELRSRLGPGLVAFIGTTRNLSDHAPQEHEVVVGPGTSQFDIVRLAKSDAVNYDLTTEDLIHQLRDWDEQFGIDIFQAETNTIRLLLRNLPHDLADFADQVYDFCPDIVDQGTGDMPTLIELIEETQHLYLWWD